MRAATLFCSKKINLNIPVLSPVQNSLILSRQYKKQNLKFCRSPLTRQFKIIQFSVQALCTSKQ
jgi:hypothetical protein